MYSAMRNVILKSFENFITQPLGILRNKIIQIANLKSDFVSSKSVNVELFEDTIQVNVVNNESVYNLLSAVVYKKRLNELRTPNYEDKTSEFFNQLSKS